MMPAGYLAFFQFKEHTSEDVFPVVSICFFQTCPVVHFKKEARNPAGTRQNVVVLTSFQCFDVVSTSIQRRVLAGKRENESKCSQYFLPNTPFSTRPTEICKLCEKFLCITPPSFPGIKHNTVRTQFLVCMYCSCWLLSIIKET